MLYRHVFDKISTEFRGPATVRRIRGPVLENNKIAVERD